MKADCVTFQAMDPEMCTILIFYKRVWDELLHPILCIFQEKYLLCYILLTD